MNHHALGLVDYDNVVVLVYHIQGDIFGQSLALATFRESNLHLVARLYSILLGLDDTGDGDSALLNKPCRRRAGNVCYLRGVGVEPLATVGVLY